MDATGDATTFLQGRSRETRIHRDARGRWYNDGEPIAHPKLTRALDGWIDRAADGRLCLRNSINWAYVRIEGPPYFVRSVHRSVEAGKPEQLWLHLSGQRQEQLVPATLRRSAEDVLWCDVLEGRCAARFDSHASTQLAEWLDEDDRGVFLELDGSKHYPQTVRDPLVSLAGTVVE